MERIPHQPTRGGERVRRAEMCPCRKDAEKRDSVTGKRKISSIGGFGGSFQKTRALEKEKGDESSTHDEAENHASTKISV